MFLLCNNFAGCFNLALYGQSVLVMKVKRKMVNENASLLFWIILPAK